jgi:hypothetical protein
VSGKWNAPFDAIDPLAARTTAPAPFHTNLTFFNPLRSSRRFRLHYTYDHDEELVSEHSVLAAGSSPCWGALGRRTSSSSAWRGEADEIDHDEDENGWQVLAGFSSCYCSPRP